MKKLNQKGFGAVEIVLLVVLVGIIAGAGWYVYQSQKKTKESLDNANQNIEQISKSNKEINEADKKSENSSKKYLEIKELGVKVELDDATADAYYVMQNGFAYISTTSLKNAGPECSAEKTGVVAISKVNKTDTDEMTGKTYEQQIKDGGSGVIIGNNVYLMNRSQAYCSEDVDVQAKQQAAWNSFLAQAKTMQAL